MNHDQFSRRLFVAVHAGAGYHSREKEADYRKLCKQACLKAMTVLAKKLSAVEGAAAAVMVLEDSEITNAGKGSSLTMSGTVECDASVMEGSSTLFGAVGCISGVVNPVAVARQLLISQREDSLSHGRVPPSVLVSNGAREWAEQRGFSVDNHHQLITDKTKQLHKKYKWRVEGDSALRTKRLKLDGVCSNDSSGDMRSNCHQSDSQNSQHSASDHASQNIHHSTSIQASQNSQHSTSDQASLEGLPGVQDTVGAVCVDFEGNVAAAVSSGGIWLKQPGRLGPAAVYGAGCWAENAAKPGDPGIAVITSGCGEHIMRTLLAKTCADHVRTSDNASQGLSTCFQSYFLGSSLLPNIDSKLAGAVALKICVLPDHFDYELVWGHTTESMAVGYMSGGNKKPKVLISRLGDGCLAGKSFTVSGAHFSTSLEPTQD